VYSFAIFWTDHVFLQNWVEKCKKNRNKQTKRIALLRGLHLFGLDLDGGL
jgi:hypothetical protein